MGGNSLPVGERAKLGIFLPSGFLGFFHHFGVKIRATFHDIGVVALATFECI